jgi:hypothetical protein
MKTTAVLIIAAVTVSAQMRDARHSRDGPVEDCGRVKGWTRFHHEGRDDRGLAGHEGGEYRVLRQGTSEGTCLPGPPPGYTHHEPGWFDKTFFQWLKDGLVGPPQHIDKLGLAYMYVGAWVPNRSGKTTENEFHVGPHIMVVSPHPDVLQDFNRDGSNGMSYVTH